MDSRLITKETSIEEDDQITKMNSTNVSVTQDQDSRMKNNETKSHNNALTSETSRNSPRDSIFDKSQRKLTTQITPRVGIYLL